MTKQRKTGGFTLIELMVVVAVIGLLAAIAYPSYIDHVRKSRRALAKAALMEAAQKQEAYYARNATYTDDLTNLGYAADPIDVKSDGGTAYYEMLANDPAAVTTKTGNAGCPLTRCYAITVRAKGDQLNDDVSRFRLWSDGAKEHKNQSGWALGWPD